MKLLDNTAFSGGSVSDSSQNTIGLRFTVEEECQATGVWFYLHTNSSAARPDQLELWEQDTPSTGELLASTPAITSSGTIQWHFEPFSAPVTLLPGIIYVVAGVWNGTVSMPTVSAGAPTAAPYPLVFEANYNARLDPGDGFPPAVVGGNAWGLDVEIDEATVGGGGGGADGDPPTNANVSARLAQWLSADPDAQEHEADGLPWLSKIVLDTIEGTQITHTGVLANILTKLGGAGGTTLQSYLQTLTNMVGTIAGAVSIGEWLAYHFGDGNSTPTGEKIDAIASAVGDYNRSPQDVVPVGDVGWTAVDTILGSGAFFWDFPADRYVLTITAYGSHRAYNEVGTIPYWLHRGFWAVVNGDMVGHYYPIVGHKHQLYEVGSRLPGVLIGLDDDIEWTLTAYDYTA